MSGRLRMLVYLALAALLAAHPKTQPATTCPHPCHCLRRSQAIQSRIMADCNSRYPAYPAPRGRADERRWAKCMERVPMHCDVLSDARYWELAAEFGDVMFDARTACGKQCERTRCGCSDGPVCEFEIGRGR